MMQHRNLRRRSLALASVITLAMTLVGSTLAVLVQDADRQQRQLRRTPRPEFRWQDWDGVYFEDLFADGLVGQRPEKLTAEQIANRNATTPDNSTTGTAESGAGGFAWKNLVSPTTLEDEVKSLQQQLAVDITTPGKFKTDYALAHQSFSMLSLLFAVIRQYDGDVRWHEEAGDAQAAFARAAANSRVGTIQAYESCKRRAQILQDMVRGGSYSGTEKASDSLDWSQVVGHSPVMERLEVLHRDLKQLTARPGEFSESIGEVLHQSELIALLAATVQQEGMEYASEEGYVEYARQMQEAAVAVARGCRENDFEAVSQGVNTIGQSCTNCHEEWR